MNWISIIFCAFMLLKISTPVSAESIAEASKQLASEILPIMELVLGNIEKESLKNNNALKKLMRDSTNLINQKMKPIEEKYNTVYIALQKEMTDTTERFDKKWKKQQEESTKEINEMRKKLEDQRKDVNVKSIRKITELEQKIKELSQGTNQAPNQMDVIADQLQKVWNDNYGINEEMKDRLKKIDEELAMIQDDIKIKDKDIKKLQKDDRTILKTLGENSDAINEKIKENEKTVKLIEQKCQVGCSGSAPSPNPSPTSDNKSINDLAARFLAMTTTARQNFINLENKVIKTKNLSQDLITNSTSIFENKIMELKASILSVDNKSKNQFEHSEKYIVDLGNVLNRMKKDSARYFVFADNLNKLIIKNYGKPKLLVDYTI